jgi:hypothetical protein
MDLDSRLVLFVLVHFAIRTAIGFDYRTPASFDSNLPFSETSTSPPTFIYENQEQILYKKLLGSYDPAVRPVLNHTMTLKIILRMKLYQILELSEKDQTLTTNIWMEQV